MGWKKKAKLQFCSPPNPVSNRVKFARNIRPKEADHLSHFFHIQSKNVKDENVFNDVDVRVLVEVCQKNVAEQEDEEKVGDLERKENIQNSHELCCSTFAQVSTYTVTSKRNDRWLVEIKDLSPPITKRRRAASVFTSARFLWRDVSVETSSTSGSWGP